MGLLTDTKQRQRFSDIVTKHGDKICWLSYVAGVIWFCALAYVPLNANTYFSENALLPGLVHNEFYGSHDMDSFYSDLKAEMKKLEKLSDEQDEKYLAPAGWFETKFRELGLDTYVQNFSFTYPGNMLRGQEFPGKNIYGILRAPRGASTEALVMSAPYRPKGSEFSINNGAMAVMLGMAKYFRKKSYWAKDVIFLVTEHEQIGMQAWLAAYHHEQAQYIKSGDLHGRSGSIQAAINLEIPFNRISRFNLKINGQNGQLPNLDLVNTVTKLCRDNLIAPTLSKQVDGHFRPDSFDGFQYSLKTMLRMMWHQATGSTNGNHGLFHKYRIEALTLEGTSRRGERRGVTFDNIGKVMEGIFRSLNNLLERFHQSFFFYILPATHRYVSIGLYMPPFGLIAGGLVIKALGLWLRSQPDETKPTQKKVSQVREAGDQAQDDSSDSDIDDPRGENPGLLSLIPTLIMAAFFGLAGYCSPDYFISMSHSFHIQPSESLMWGMVALSMSGCMFPRVLRKKTVDSGDLGADWMIQKYVALIMLGLMLGAVAILNISLAFFLAVTMTPVALIVKPTKNKFGNLGQYVILLAVNPLVLLGIGGVINSYMMSDKQADLMDLLTIGWSQSQHALLVSVVEGALFGSWIFTLATLVIFPIWLLLWSLLWAQPN